VEAIDLVEIDHLKLSKTEIRVKSVVSLAFSKRVHENATSH